MSSSSTVRHVRAICSSENRAGKREKRRVRPPAPLPSSAMIARASAAEARQVQRPEPLSDFKVPGIVLSVEKEIPSDLTLLDGVLVKMIAAIEGTKWCEDTECIGLALREAIANAIVHGNQLDPAKLVRIAVSVNDDGALLIRVKDSGSGFDPSRLPNPIADENLFAEHGRGIFLMKQFMDQVEFSFDHGTEVRMYKRRYWLD
jgi:anti-sigma regulatory factor (Ser/Thr protein kinase)